jgi:hypothetical protein
MEEISKDNIIEIKNIFDNHFNIIAFNLPAAHQASIRFFASLCCSNIIQKLIKFRKTLKDYEEEKELENKNKNSSYSLISMDIITDPPYEYIDYPVSNLYYFHLLFDIFKILFLHSNPEILPFLTNEENRLGMIKFYIKKNKINDLQYFCRCFIMHGI